jgi:hypothetical protein
MPAVLTPAAQIGCTLFISQMSYFSNELGLSEDQEDKLRSLIEEGVSDLMPIVADLVLARGTEERHQRLLSGQRVLSRGVVRMFHP